MDIYQFHFWIFIFQLFYIYLFFVLKKDARVIGVFIFCTCYPMLLVDILSPLYFGFIFLDKLALLVSPFIEQFSSTYLDFITLSIYLFVSFFLSSFYPLSSFLSHGERLMVDQSRTSRRFNEPHHFSSWFHPTCHYSRWATREERAIDEGCLLVSSLYRCFFVVMVCGKIGFAQDVPIASIVGEWKNWVMAREW